uniref:Interleukin-17 receptor E n=1 Tax=Phascolarctos cinereus TaxID=38626 RepID=A0A6P5JTD7_PHACI|nr:interleukin-17 receptor E isoform X3 [Phascolarctos cinereus]
MKHRKPQETRNWEQNSFPEQALARKKRNVVWPAGEQLRRSFRADTGAGSGWSVLYRRGTPGSPSPAMQPCSQCADLSDAHGEPAARGSPRSLFASSHQPFWLFWEQVLSCELVGAPLFSIFPHESPALDLHQNGVLSKRSQCSLARRCPLCFHIQLALSMPGLRKPWLHFLMRKSPKSPKFQLCTRLRMPTAAQWKWLCDCCLARQGHRVAVSFPAVPSSGLRLKRTQFSLPEIADGTSQLPVSQGPRGPEFSFVLLLGERAVQVTAPLGPDISVRLCHQWVLECEELSSPFHKQETVSGGHTIQLPYEFLLPCLCIEAAYLHHDSVRRKQCPLKDQPEVYSMDFWRSVQFIDHSYQDQMAMILTLRCPVKLKASLCQKQSWHSPCEDLPNATVSSSEGWYVLEKVDLHPHLCFKFSLGNSTHVECPHRNASSWNVSMDIQYQRLVLHFSSRTPAAFSVAWCLPGVEHYDPQLPVYSVSQPNGSGPVKSDLIIPLQSFGGCVLVWRSDVQYSQKRLLCPNVSHRHLGLLALGLLMGAALLVTILALNYQGLQRLLTGPGRPRPVLLLYSADSEAHRRLVGALAELLRVALGGGEDVILDLWEGERVARLGPLPWLCGAQARVAQERGTVLLLWSRTSSHLYRRWRAGAGPRCAQDPQDLFRAALSCYLHPGPGTAGGARPPLLAFFSKLCAKGDIPRPLRTLPRFRLLGDLPQLLRALGAEDALRAPAWLGLRPRPRPPPSERADWQCYLRNRLELCQRLEREAAQVELLSSDRG